MKLEDYALIGDCETAALVGSNGSIDWLCCPDFSSPACFAALWGTRRNGRWRIAPKERPHKVTRRYRDHTLILETTFETSSGIVVLTDFMPIRERHSDVARIVRSFKVESAWRWSYAFASTTVVPFHGQEHSGGTNGLPLPAPVSYTFVPSSICDPTTL